MTAAPRRCIAVLALLSASCLAAASCSSHRGDNPDPGNRRFHTLVSDPIFAQLPPGANRTDLHEDRATYQDNGPFVGSGWTGPGLTLEFTSKRSVHQVYRFYAKRAAENDWQREDERSHRYRHDAWQKDVGDTRYVVDLYFPDPEMHTAKGTPKGYRLYGGVLCSSRSAKLGPTC